MRREAKFAIDNDRCEKIVYFLVELAQVLLIQRFARKSVGAVARLDRQFVNDFGARLLVNTIKCHPTDSASKKIAAPLGAAPRLGHRASEECRLSHAFSKICRFRKRGQIFVR